MPATSRNKRAAFPFDKEAGARIKHERTMKGLTQQQLADRIGVTYQQLHKYEQAINRMSVGAFMAICRALEIQPGAVLDGGGATPKQPRPGRTMELELMRCFQQIESPTQRAAVVAMCREMVKA